jgi:hypothetical protein
LLAVRNSLQPARHRRRNEGAERQPRDQREARIVFFI